MIKANEQIEYLTEKIEIYEELFDRVKEELSNDQQRDIFYELADYFIAGASYSFDNGTMEMINTEASDMEDMLDDMRNHKCSTWGDFSNLVIDTFIETMKKHLLNAKLT